MEECKIYTLGMSCVALHKLILQNDTTERETIFYFVNRNFLSINFVVQLQAVL